jgi:hypothetical protein
MDQPGSVAVHFKWNFEPDWKFVHFFLCGFPRNQEIAKKARFFLTWETTKNLSPGPENCSFTPVCGPNVSKQFGY